MSCEALDYDMCLMLCETLSCNVGVLNCKSGFCRVLWVVIVVSTLGHGCWCIRLSSEQNCRKPYTLPSFLCWSGYIS
jgi:hypothetical protein